MAVKLVKKKIKKKNNAVFLFFKMAISFLKLYRIGIYPV